MKKRDNFLVFGRPYIGEEEIAEVVETLRSGWWGTGPRVEKFEGSFKDYVGSNFCMAVNSATAGLHLALKAIDIKQGDEVITTPMTFCSTANVIIHSGAKPVFADIDIEDWNIDPKEIERKITKKTKAIIPVHLHGRPCQMKEILSLAKKYKLKVICDAAHAIETKYHGKSSGVLGDISIFSFYVTKNLATGEGGMVSTNDESWAKKIKILSLHGLSRDAYKRYSTKVFRHYKTTCPGYKYNMTDIQAAIGIHQLARIEDNARLRKKYWEMYNEAFKSCQELILPKEEEEGTYHARHLYAILIRPEKLKVKRDQFIDNLLKLNIGSGIHFYPIHLHPFYQKTFKFKRGDFPNAEFVGDRTLSLPLGANLGEEDINDVIGAVKEIIRRYKK